MNEHYRPTSEEMNAAQEVMTDGQKEMSERREYVLKILDTSHGGARYILEARVFKIPEEKIKSYAFRVIEYDARAGINPNISFRMAEHTHVATREEVNAIIQKVYEEIYAEYPSNIYVAKYLFGEESKEYRRAEALADQEEEERKKQEKAVRKKRTWSIRTERKIEGGETLESKTVILHQDAAFADLFEAIESDRDTTEPNLNEIFWSEVYYNVDEEMQTELQTLHVDDPEKSKATKVLAFFKERGFSQSDVEVYFPIRFHKKPKGK